MTDKKIILSLCDYSGRWPEFYRQDPAYLVVTVDLKEIREPIPNRVHIAADVRKLTLEELTQRIGLSRQKIQGVISAPPCTDFSVSGAQYWKAKDADGRTKASMEIVGACQWFEEELKPEWWALKNPVGRLRHFIGAPSWSFDPCDYAGYGDESDRYTKKTLIWGTAKKPEVKRLEPIRACAQGSWLQKLGGKSERTKELRSMTPLGFAKAFKEANP